MVLVDQNHLVFFQTKSPQNQWDVDQSGAVVYTDVGVIKVTLIVDFFISITFISILRLRFPKN